MKRLFNKNIAVCLLIIIWFNNLSAQTDIYNSDSTLINITQQFNNFQNGVILSFDDFQEKQKKEFSEFKERIDKLWGTNNSKFSDPVKWIEYFNNKSRSVVDFKKGKATYEILISPKEVKDSVKINRHLRKIIKKNILSKGNINNKESSGITNNNLEQEPVLDQQIINKDGKIVTKDNIDAFTNEVVNSHKTVIKNIKGNDGKQRTLVSVSISLAPNYLQVRAQKILPVILKYSNKFNIEPELILSIIHVESYFNPKSISKANAIGLMQIVPSTGGIEAYKYLYNKNVKLTKSYLLNPSANIELGTAYLSILMNKYFKGIINNDSKRFCTISSYNAGIGNVCVILSGTKMINRTVKTVNMITPEKLYYYLSHNFKSKEARDYIEKVNTKYIMYKTWVKNYL